MLKRSIAVVIAMAFSVFIAAGCGSSPMSKSEYIKEMDKVGASYAQKMKGMSGTDKAPTAASMKKVADGLEEIADDMDDMNPPKDIAATHKKFAKALHELSKYVGTDLVKALKKAGKDPEAVTGALMGIMSVGAVEDLGEVTKAYDKHGYGAVNKSIAGSMKDNA